MPTCSTESSITSATTSGQTWTSASAFPAASTYVWYCPSVSAMQRVTPSQRMCRRRTPPSNQEPSITQRITSIVTVISSSPMAGNRPIVQDLETCKSSSTGWPCPKRNTANGPIYCSASPILPPRVRCASAITQPTETACIGCKRVSLQAAKSLLRSLISKCCIQHPLAAHATSSPPTYPTSRTISQGTNSIW